MATASLFEKLGGQDTIDKVVDSFYVKVLADDEVKSFFEHTDMAQQRRHQAAFIGYALGSGVEFTGRSMAKSHEGMNLQPNHFQAIVKHLTDTLREFKVDEADIRTIGDTVGKLQNDILYK